MKVAAGPTGRSTHLTGHMATTLPAAVFIVAHLYARLRPASLWGVDSLTYYGPLTCALFVALPLLALTLPVSLLPAAVRQRISGLILPPWFGWGLAVAALPLFWFGRVRVHALGDSVKWFAVVGNAIGHYRPFSDIPWHNASLKVPGLEFINFQQALDLLLHVGVYALLHTFGVTEPQRAYEWVSILAGGLYVLALWSLALRLSTSSGNRLAVFGFLLSLGTLQLFCGYGESYTLVTLLCVLYLTCAVDALRGSRPLWQAGAILALAGATHMLAVSLAPSFALLLWHHGRWGAMLRRRRVQVPLAVFGLLGAVLVYTGFYQGLHLPLLTSDAPGRYALLSWRHVATLGNALLLTGPFALFWGLLALCRQPPSTRELRFLGVAALGAALLVGVHDITMGGRDWDLMSFPTLLVAAWGILSLQTLVPGETTHPLVRSILPVMALHTLPWIGVNASPTRATQRLEQLLLGDTNQSTHYRAWTLGYYYLEHGERGAAAATAFADAVAQAPAETIDTPGTREFSYRKYYASALVRSGRRGEALVMIRDIYHRQPNPYEGTDDITLHWDWARASFRLAEEAAARADSTSARELWTESRIALERLASWVDSPGSHEDLATVLDRLGYHNEAILERYLRIRPEQDAVEMMLNEGDSHLAAHEPNLAAVAYGALLRGQAGQALDAAQYLRVGIRLYKAGDLQQAIVALRQSVALEAENELAQRNLGWLLLLAENTDDAVRHLHDAVSIRATAEAMFTLAFAHMAAGQPDSSAAAYADAVRTYGVEGGALVGARDNLTWLIGRGVQAEPARAIRQLYWPEP